MRTALPLVAPTKPAMALTNRLYCAAGPRYSSAPMDTVLQWNHGRKVAQTACMVGIASGCVMLSRL